MLENESAGSVPDALRVAIFDQGEGNPHSKN